MLLAWQKELLTVNRAGIVQDLVVTETLCTGLVHYGIITEQKLTNIKVSVLYMFSIILLSLIYHMV